MSAQITGTLNETFIVSSKIRYLLKNPAKGGIPIIEKIVGISKDIIG
jgi:D-hexose-6-phosphate mutarotase